MWFACTELTVEFGNGSLPQRALADVSFTCGQGEFLSVIGPSGCGKTTLLRAVAGIVKPAGGAIEWEPGAGEPSARLMVYQEDSLFPWMTVLENAAFGLEMKARAAGEREQAARAMLARYGLAGRERAYPHQISAGMKQRVAVIRAFLSEPALLLMDEPFGALDSPTRFALQSDLLELWRESGSSVLFVTHDVDEAIYLSDRVLVMSAAPGRIQTEVVVDLPRGDRRDALFSERFLELKREVMAHLNGASGAAKRGAHAA